LVRKGLSRKAQLSYYLAKFTAKHADSVLWGAVPPSIILDTWEAFEGRMSFGAIGTR
jgi:tubulin---tyrosine ligase